MKAMCGSTDRRIVYYGGEPPMSPTLTDSTSRPSTHNSPTVSNARLPRTRRRAPKTRSRAPMTRSQASETNVGKGRNNATRPWPDDGVHALPLEELITYPIREIYAKLHERNMYAEWAIEKQVWTGTYISNAPCFTETEEEAADLYAVLKASEVPDGCEKLLEQAYDETRGYKNRNSARTSRDKKKLESRQLQARNVAFEAQVSALQQELTETRERLHMLQGGNQDLRTVHSGTGNAHSYTGSLLPDMASLHVRERPDDGWGTPVWSAADARGVTPVCVSPNELNHGGHLMATMDIDDEHELELLQ